MVDVARDHDTDDSGAPPSASAPAGGRPAGSAGRLHAALGPLWRDRRIAVAVAVALAGGYALLAAWWTPRGPITTSQAVSAIGISLIVGAVAGLVLRSRWALLLGPATFMAVFELARMGTAGPMVDGIHLGSTYGLVAFALGRGLHAVLALVPMLLGATLGVAAARHLDGVVPVRGGGRGTGCGCAVPASLCSAWGCWS